MANVKISELTAITSSDDLADADIIPLVDSSDCLLYTSDAADE